MVANGHPPLFKIRAYQRPRRRTKKEVIEYWNNYHSAMAPWGGLFAPRDYSESSQNLEETGIARDELYDRGRSNNGQGR